MLAISGVAGFKGDWRGLAQHIAMNRVTKHKAGTRLLVDRPKNCSLTGVLPGKTDQSRAMGSAQAQSSLDFVHPEFSHGKCPMTCDGMKDRPMKK
jgi:hypothetical protein